MSDKIIGNSYSYKIDSSYGINQDGFIAIGSESIVYKGIKTNQNGDLQFSCVLKFKPKSILVNGDVVNRLEVFKTEEWKIFDDLSECRSVVHIEDVIEDLGDFSLPCNKIADGVINDESYFCVVEEYIDGWSLEEYCREEYWKLRRIEPLDNGLSKTVDYHDFSVEEKTAVKMSYNYDNILKYQNQMMLFMINLCEIMEFVTEQKNILHLDIKPENIMVTKFGKELVLIDFGKSKKVTRGNRVVKSDLVPVDFNENETVERMYQYGTLGYAAPECYSQATNGSKFPFSNNLNQGRMSIESDIFSFGATFWECLNIFELVTESHQYSKDTHDFYRNNFLNDSAYFNRDLSCTSLYYHKKLESILKKCTHERNSTIFDAENNEYYHTYKELRKDIENAKDSTPTIVKEENVKVKNAFSMSGSMIALCTVFLMIYGIYSVMAFSNAERKWDTLTSDYNETQFYKLEEVANDLITTAPSGRVNDTYAEISSFTYKDGDDISDYEAVLLVDLLQQIDDDKLLPERVDEIMRNANTKKFREISIEIMKLDVKGDSVGYDLAKAIYNVEVGKTGIVDAYEVLEKYKDNDDFHNAVIKLRNVLDTDEYINTIASELELSRPEVQATLRNVGTNSGEVTQ